jgi:hypothetical protein
MAMIGCARQRHDSAAIRIEKLKIRGQQLHEFRAESDVELEVKPRIPGSSEQGKKIALFFKSSEPKTLHNNICSLVIFALTKFGNQRIMYI